MKTVKSRTSFSKLLRHWQFVALTAVVASHTGHADTTVEAITSGLNGDAAAPVVAPSAPTTPLPAATISSRSPVRSEVEPTVATASAPVLTPLETPPKTRTLNRTPELDDSQFAPIGQPLAILLDRASPACLQCPVIEQISKPVRRWTPPAPSRQQGLNTTAGAAAPQLIRSRYTDFKRHSPLSWQQTQEMDYILRMPNGTRSTVRGFAGELRVGDRVQDDGALKKLLADTPKSLPTATRP